ncbi:MAG TPA: MbnP family copper-binding protein [Steroidobacteraceae bacterium]|nr:MbnP family copper-binding protein [Steroidobacteraceae bacterium]
MFSRPPRISAGTLLILLPALAVGVTLLSSCGSSATQVAIRFGVENAAADSADVHTLQFYVHAIELIDEHGKPRPFRIAAEPPWRNESVALIDLVGDSKTPQTVVVNGTVEGGAAAYSGIRLTVGVPFELNHGNPLAAAPPLDRGEMFWNWHSGHKFLRADLAVAGREWAFHLGSTGCSSASALRPPAQPCAQPNQMRVELKGDPLRGAVRLRLDPLIAAARSADYVVCTGDYQHEPACRDAYAATGLKPGMPQSLWVLK